MRRLAVVLATILSSAIHLTAQTMPGWQRVVELTGMSVRGLEVADSVHAMALVHEGFRIATHILTTSDRGRTWRRTLFDTLRTPRDPYPLFVHDLAYPSPDTAFVTADSNTVFRTTDRGASWTSTRFSGPHGWAMPISMWDARRGAVVAGDPARLYLTTDAGESWSEVERARWVPEIDLDWGISSATLSSANRIVLVVRGRSDSVVTARSDDFGVTWQTSVDILPEHRQIGELDLVFQTESSGWAITWRGHPDRLVGPLLARTDDGGLTWRVVLDSMVGRLPMRTTSAAFADSLNGLIVGGRGVIRTSDGGSTWRLDTVLEEVALRHVRLFDAHEAIAGSEHGSLFHALLHPPASAEVDHAAAFVGVVVDLRTGVLRLRTASAIIESRAAIVDLRGAIVRRPILEPDTGREHRLSVPDLPRGAYLLIVATRDGTLALPFLAR